jgi:hypothetical protein
MAMEQEPMLQSEVRAYLEALQEMTTAAKVGASTLRTAVTRIGRKDDSPPSSAV